MSAKIGDIVSSEFMGYVESNLPDEQTRLEIKLYDKLFQIYKIWKQNINNEKFSNFISNIQKNLTPAESDEIRGFFHWLSKIPHQRKIEEIENIFQYKKFIEKIYDLFENFENSTNLKLN